MKRSRFLLSLTIIFFWASEYCHAPYFTPYLQTLGFTASVIGILTGAYGFSQMIVRIPLGIVTDVTGCYKRTILMGTVFTTISSFTLMFSTHFVTILICRMLAGIAASSWLAFTILYAAYYDPDKSVQAMADISAYNSAGKLLAFILGMITASIWGYRVPLFCSFLTGVIAIICACSLKPVSIKREPMQVKHIASVFLNPIVLWSSFFAIIMHMVLQGTVYSFTSAIAKELGASALQIGINTTLFTIIQIICAGFVGKRLLKYLSTWQTITAGFLLLAIHCILVAFASNMFSLYIAQILGGFSNLALFSILSSLIIRFIPQENQSTAMGLFQALYGIGMTLGPVMVGNISAQYNYCTAYLVIAGITVIAAIIAPFALAKHNIT